MAAAVQTNLSVAFTHGAQLTMDHCGALIHGAAILWSHLPGQLPQESLLLCTTVSQLYTPLRLEPADATRPAWIGSMVAILFASIFENQEDWVATLREHSVSAGYVQYIRVFGLACTHELVYLTCKCI